jgi:hypothetical protein
MTASGRLLPFVTVRDFSGSASCYADLNSQERREANSHAHRSSRKERNGDRVMRFAFGINFNLDRYYDPFTLSFTSLRLPLLRHVDPRVGGHAGRR